MFSVAGMLVVGGAAGSGAALWQADSARMSRRMSEVLKVGFMILLEREVEK